jgi:hypothetical protein
MPEGRIPRISALPLRFQITTTNLLELANDRRDGESISARTIRLSTLGQANILGIANLCHLTSNYRRRAEPLRAWKAAQRYARSGLNFGLNGVRMSEIRKSERRLASTTGCH